MLGIFRVDTFAAWRFGGRNTCDNCDDHYQELNENLFQMNANPGDLSSPSIINLAADTVIASWISEGDLVCRVNSIKFGVTVTESSSTVDSPWTQFPIGSDKH